MIIELIIQNDATDTTAEGVQRLFHAVSPVRCLFAYGGSLLKNAPTRGRTGASEAIWDPTTCARRAKEAALGGDLHGLYCRKRLYGSERHAAFYTAGVKMHPCAGVSSCGHAFRTLYELLLIRRVLLSVNKTPYDFAQLVGCIAHSSINAASPPPCLSRLVRPGVSGLN